MRAHYIQHSVLYSVEQYIMEWLQGGGTYGSICLGLLMPTELSIVWVSNQCPTYRHVFPIFIHAF